MKRVFNCRICFFCLVIISSANVFAIPPKLNFRHISIEEGLSNSTIETIYQDKRGFIWFGTRDGLNRYDGNKINIFRYNSNNTNSISDNYIKYIYEDSKQQIWIGTINGLNKFDPAINQFVQYKLPPANNPNSNSISCIYEDKKGNLWVSTLGNGIMVFTANRQSFTQYKNNVSTGSLPSNRVNNLYEDSKGNFWILTDVGLCLFDKASQQFKTLSNSSCLNIFKNNNITTIKEDKAGNLWMGTENNGLLVFNYQKNTCQQFRHQVKTASSLSSNQVRAILIDHEQHIWIGGINGGLDLFEPTTNSFFHYQNQPDNAFSLSQRTVSALFEDNQYNLWVGTHRGGINLHSPNTKKFTLYKQEAIANSLSYNDVKAFCEDKTGNIWIGTDGGGLNKFDRNTNSFQHFKYNPYNSTSVGSNEILSITEDSDNNLWVATWGGGLCLLNRTNGSFTRLMHDSANNQSISSNYVQKVFEDSKKRLWVATYYGGLNLYDKRTKTFTRITADASNSSKLLGNNILSLVEDKQGNIWIGTDDGGLNCYLANTQNFVHYFTKNEKMPDLRVLFIDSKNRLWVGQYGLYLFNSQHNTFNLFTEKAGLSSEFIKGIAEDTQSNFWVATSNGITKFNPSNSSFNKYNTADGLQGLEFEANAYLTTKDGAVFFGGTNGFNSFYPSNITSNNFIPPVYVTEFLLLNKSVLPNVDDSPLKNDISYTKNIELDYKQSTFSFGFSALNYTALANNQYAYKLENWDNDWHIASNEKIASYTNVSPGHYTFKIRVSNNDGVWKDTGSNISITIVPPFWNTLWFKTLLFLVTVTGLFYWNRSKRNLELQKLEEKKKEEVYQMQLQFFTNISHEFRTPLSLILGPLENLQKEDSKFTHYYNVMYRNATRLLHLINELMDFRKSELGVLKLHVMPGHIDLFLQEIAASFTEIAAEKNITFTVTVVDNIEDTWFDRQVLEKIVLNLIGNAFKYTNNGGNISIEVLTTLQDFKPLFSNELVLKSTYQSARYIYLKVTDSGIGISKASIAHLFERYYKINDTHMGSGIGLAFVKSLATLHKSHIYVYSESNKGTEIIIGIPVNKDDYSVQERWINQADKMGEVRLESIQDKHEILETDTLLTKADETFNDTLLPYILLVEDNEELRAFLKNSLAANYHIVEAKNGLEGIDIAKDLMPDLIISDVMMPKMDGIEFCKRIKEDIATSHIPFIMLTAKNALEARLDGISSGADFYFAKPLSIPFLQLTLKNILLQKQKLKAHYQNNQYAEAKDLVHSTIDKQFLEELISIIETHLINPDMDVDYICTQIGMSKTKLYQKVKKITDQSIGEFIRNIRFKKAAQLMTTEDLPLSEVMYLVGIQTQSYFTKAFKQKFGKTPTQFLTDLKK